jgi:septum formation protein
MNPPLVLASTSPYRAELLGRLALPFATAAPGVDETRQAGEPPEALVRRLARAKAEAVAGRRPEAVVLGSDQCLSLDGEVLGKPGGFDAARDQLRRVSGRRVTFLTAVCRAGPEGAEPETALVPFTVAFRTLSDQTITRYLQRDAPYDCAGSLRSEGLGVALMAATEGDDATALTGLPLIATVRLLEEAGIPVL